jgi:hypothetical protein
MNPESQSDRTCDDHYEWHVRTAHAPQICGCPVGEHRRLT